MLIVLLELYDTDPCKLLSELIVRVVVVPPVVVMVMSPDAEIVNLLRLALQPELQTLLVSVFALQSHMPRYREPPCEPQAR